MEKKGTKKVIEEQLIKIDNIQDYLKHSELSDILVFNYNFNNYETELFILNKYSVNYIWEKINIKKNKYNIKARSDEFLYFLNKYTEHQYSKKLDLNIEKIYETMVGEKFCHFQYNLPYNWKIVFFTNNMYIDPRRIYKYKAKILDIETLEYIELSKEYHISNHKINCYEIIYNNENNSQSDYKNVNLNNRKKIVEDFFKLTMKKEAFEKLSKIMKIYMKKEEPEENIIEINDFSIHSPFFTNCQSNFTIEDIFKILFNIQHFHNVSKNPSLPNKPFMVPIKFVSHSENISKLESKKKSQNKLNEEKNEMENRNKYIEYIRRNQPSFLIAYFNIKKYTEKVVIKDIKAVNEDVFMNELIEKNKELKDKINENHNFDGYKIFSEKYGFEKMIGLKNDYDKTSLKHFIRSYKHNIIHLLLNPEQIIFK